MKAKDLPQEIKNMYKIEPRKAGSYMIESSPIYIVMDENSEFIESELDFTTTKPGFALILSKNIHHATVVIL